MPEPQAASIAQGRLRMALGRAYSEHQLGQDRDTVLRRLKDFISRHEINPIVADELASLTSNVAAANRGERSAFIERIQLRLLRQALGLPAEQPAEETPPNAA